jgi:hypothetical protein
MRYLFLLITLSASFITQAQLTITPETSYHQSSYGAEFGTLEGTTSPDLGGFITCFVKNNATAVDSIKKVSISKNGIYDSTFMTMHWPLALNPNGVAGDIAAVLLKGMNSPFKDNDTVLIEIENSTGAICSTSFINKHYPVRIANIMPSLDKKSLYLYFRNDGLTNYTVNEILLNDDLFLATSPNLVSISGGFVIPPNQILILKLNYSTAFSELTPLHLRVKFSAPSIPSFYVSTFQRFLSSTFSIGTWNSPLYDDVNKYGRKLIRQLAITSVLGPGDYSKMQTAYNQYHFKTVHEPDFYNSGVFDVNKGGQFVAQKANDEFIHYWNVGDEPDLNNKPAQEEMEQNWAYWKNDPNTPSYINLAVQKKFQQYGFFPDVVSMDHYTDDGAPNVIPLSWITREGSVREAIEYTDQLKFNTEPKRMYSWSQLAGSVWGSLQAEDYIVNFQFWSHVSSGAKGIHYFVAQPGTKANYPQQWNEAIHSTKQLNTIKNLCLFGESWNGVKVNSGAVVARALISEDAMVVVLKNNSIDYTLTNIFAHDWASSISPVAFDIEFTIPTWVSLDQFYEATSEGKKGITGLTPISGRTYRIVGNIYGKSLTFVMGKNDNQAPATPTGLNFADVISPNKFTLSWSEPQDNFGVKGYYIKADNIIVDTVRFPIWDTENAPNACSIGYWSVAAFDDAGNVSQFITITSPDLSSIGGGSPVIYVQPQSVYANAGDYVNFSIQDSSASGVAYQWQVDTGNGIWTNLVNSTKYAGVNSNSLTVYATQFNHQYDFRCSLTVGCNQATFNSSAAKLLVDGTVGFENNEVLNWQIYPNPANDYLVIHINDLKSAKYHITLTDLTGRKVLALSCNQSHTKIDVSDLAEGMYVVEVSDNHQFVSAKKVVIQRN